MAALMSYTVRMSDLGFHVRVSISKDVRFRLALAIPLLRLVGYLLDANIEIEGGSQKCT